MYYVAGIMADLTPLPLLLCIVVLIVSYIVSRILYNLYFHPLRHYPGPRLAAATPLWHVYHTLSGRLPLKLLETHENYGQVIRIAPKELSYTHPDGWKDIYSYRQGKSELDKDMRFYRDAALPGSILLANKARHPVIRKSLSNGFSEKALREQEPLVRKYADLWVSKLAEHSKLGPVNMAFWFNALTFDIIGDLTYGESFHCLENSEYHPWIASVFDFIRFGAIARMLRYFPLAEEVAMKLAPRSVLQKGEYVRAFSSEKTAQRVQMKTDRSDFAHSMMRPESGISQGGRDGEFEGTLDLLVSAGSETTASVLSGLTYLLLTNPVKMHTLTKHIRSMFQKAEHITFSSATNVPYILACLNEAMRLFPATPDGFPRTTGERHVQICGQTVPPETAVKMTHFPTYHSSKHFKQPEDFIPERWLAGSEGFEADNKAVFQPFNTGPRNCLGQNLANFEMRLFTALLLWHFDLELCPESKHWLTDIKAYFMWQKPDLFVRLRRRTEMS